MNDQKLPHVPDNMLQPGLMYLELLHGRFTADEEMTGWGFQGPTLGPLQFAHSTYGADIKLCRLGEDDACETLLMFDGLVERDGRLYGDFSLFVATEDMLDRPDRYNPEEKPDAE